MINDNEGHKYVDVPESVHKCGGGCDCIKFRSLTSVPGIPIQNDFPDSRIRNFGCCFLCTCVKGGLTTLEQCMDCFNWGINSGKLRSSDCYVNTNKENWAKEISERYGTQYHGDYCFQKNSHHFWLTQNGIEIFNSAGIGWRGAT